MKTYKFLAKGATGPLSGVKWSEPKGSAPGGWMSTDRPLELCVQGAHVCRSRDLAYWLHDELWETDVDGDAIEGIDCLVVRRARLVRRFDAWHQGGALRFAHACVDHAAELAGASGGARELVRAYLDDAAICARSGYVAVGAFTAALAVSKLGNPADEAIAYHSERVWQAGWITNVLLSA